MPCTFVFCLDLVPSAWFDCQCFSFNLTYALWTVSRVSYFQPDLEQQDADADNWGDSKRDIERRKRQRQQQRRRRARFRKPTGKAGMSASGLQQASSGISRSLSTLGALISDLLKERSKYVDEHEKWRHQAARRWRLATLQRVLLRRFRQQNCALEIFARGNGGTGSNCFATTSHFFTFNSRADRDAALEVLLKCCPAAHSAAFDSVGIPVLVQPPALADKPTELLDPSITQRWMDRELSNFEYLMMLNQASGRSNNDLSQYHVFPWILRDYSNENLDLTSPTTYRNLGKPVGALHASRLKEFRSRYRQWSDGNIPPFMSVAKLLQNLVQAPSVCRAFIHHSILLRVLQVWVALLYCSRDRVVFPCATVAVCPCALRLPKWPL